VKSIGGKFSTKLINNNVSQLFIYCFKLNHGLTKKEFAKLAFQYAIAKQINVPQSWNNEMAGKNWLWKFLKDRPVLSLQQPEKYSQVRTNGFNKVAVNEFYD